MLSRGWKKCMSHPPRYSWGSETLIVHLAGRFTHAKESTAIIAFGRRKDKVLGFQFPDNF